MHKLAGLRRGDTIVLSKENLPGAVLFPAMVCEPLPEGAPSIPAAAATSTASTAASTTTPADNNAAPESSGSSTEGKSTPATDGATSSDTPVQSSDSASTPPPSSVVEQIASSTSASDATAAAPAVAPTADVHMEHRFLAVTRERFLVLDSNGKGVGNVAVVKSNNHLTEVKYQRLLFIIRICEKHYY